jgi:1-deoxy-D-xylulose-5-phosphate reductoisomerase
MPTPKRIVILGSTGSIGTQTLGVIEHLHNSGSRYRFEVVGLAAGRASGVLAEQVGRTGARFVATAEDGDVDGAEQRFIGEHAAEELVRAAHADGGVDLVVGAIVGSAGIGATLAAIDLGIDVALANKETLVAAGELVVARANTTGARLLPVDSEHSAIWQCLQGQANTKPPMSLPGSVARMILTASGGALRGKSAKDVYNATPKEALAHPNWSMGPKVTVDCASLMNKGLELIEAHWLFGINADRLGVLVHPSSTVHSFVEYADGSVIAQLGAPDMKAPIQYALTYPDRPAGCAPKLDLAKLGSLEFYEPDAEVFPALGLAYEVIRRGGTSGAILNAANEEAVGAFLSPENADGSLVPFGFIAEAVQSAMRDIEAAPVTDLSCINTASEHARAHVREQLAAKSQ